MIIGVVIMDHVHTTVHRVIRYMALKHIRHQDRAKPVPGDQNRLLLKAMYAVRYPALPVHPVREATLPDRVMAKRPVVHHVTVAHLHEAEVVDRANNNPNLKNDIL